MKRPSRSRTIRSKQRTESARPTPTRIENAAHSVRGALGFPLPVPPQQLPAAPYLMNQDPRANAPSTRSKVALFSPTFSPSGPRVGVTRGRPLRRRKNRANSARAQGLFSAFASMARKRRRPGTSAALLRSDVAVLGRKRWPRELPSFGLLAFMPTCLKRYPAVMIAVAGPPARAPRPGQRVSAGRNPSRAGTHRVKETACKDSRAFPYRSWNWPPARTRGRDKRPCPHRDCAASG